MKEKIAIPPRPNILLLLANQRMRRNQFCFLPILRQKFFENYSPWKLKLYSPQTLDGNPCV